MPSSTVLTQNAQNLGLHTSAIRRGYIAALIILALMAVSNFLLIESLVRSQTHNFKLTENIAQIQIDLRQVRQTVELILRSIEQNSNNPQLARNTQIELLRLADNLQSNLTQLQAGANAENSLLTSQVTLKALLDEPPYNFQTNLISVISDLKALSQVNPEVLYWRFSMWAPIELKLANNSQLSQGTVHLSSALYKQTSENSQSISTIHNVLIFITLASLLAEALLIFRPLLKRLSRTQKQLLQGYERMRVLSTTDSLTQAGNRHAFKELLHTLCVAQPGPPLGLMLIDLDDFKNINDVTGHAAGDFVLQIICKRIQAKFEGKGQTFRVGGDEFAVVIQDAATLKDMTTIASELLTSISAPITYENHPLFVGACIGIAIASNSDSFSEENILKQADFVLRTAKKKGRGNLHLFTSIDADVSNRSELLASELSQALSKGQLVPHYQPIISISNGELLGVEALMRWEKSADTVVMPSGFLEVIEEYGLMRLMTESLISKVAQDRQVCLAAGFDPGKFSINLAEPSLVDRQLPIRIGQLTNTQDLRWLQVEVVETALLHRASGIIENNLRELQSMGVSVALDDFGTGHASLSHLRNFPCNTVKIDRSFVQGLIEEKESQLIVSGMLNIVHGLKMNIVVEGIETRAQYDFFKAWPSIGGQGYLIGKAMTIEQLIKNRYASARTS